MRKTLSTLAAVAVGRAALLGGSEAQARRSTIARIPGLITDAFDITMRKGAEAAAKALGADLVFQGAPEFDAVQQVPVLDAVIARHPDVILIAPTARTQLVQPLKRAVDAGIPIITVDTSTGSGVYGTGAGDAELPLSSIASDNLLGGRMAARALALIRALRAQHRGVVFISHSLQDISAVADRIVVLRRGSLPGERRAADTSPDEIVELMTGG